MILQEVDASKKEDEEETDEDGEFQEWLNEVYWYDEEKLPGRSNKKNSE